MFKLRSEVVTGCDEFVCVMMFSFGPALDHMLG